MNRNSLFTLAILFVMTFLAASCQKEDVKPTDPTVEKLPTFYSKSQTLEPGQNDLFAPNSPSNAVVSLKNQTGEPLIMYCEVVADDQGTTRVLERPLDPGCSFTEEFPSLVAVFCQLPTAPIPGIPVIDVFVAYVPTDGDNGFSAADWLSAGLVCINAEVESAPDQDIDCLWETETIYQTVQPRTVNLEIHVTGQHDMQVDIETEGGVFQGYNVSAAPALPQFQSLVGEWEDVIAIHVHCEKSPVNDCDSCDYTYEICYQ